MKTKLSLLGSNLKDAAMMMTAIALFSFLFILAVLSLGLLDLLVAGSEDYNLFRKMFWTLTWNLSGPTFVILAIAMTLESLPFHFKKFFREIVKPAISGLILVVLGAIVLSIFKVVLPLTICAIIWFVSTALGYARAIKDKTVRD